MNKKVAIVGVGMDGGGTLTAEAREAVENAGELMGAGRLMELFSHLDKPRFVSYNAAEIAERIAGSSHKNIAVLMSGDCGFYSGAKGLLPLLGGCEVRVVPGISTPAYFCARLKMPWSDLCFVSLHAGEGNIVRPVLSHRKTFFLLGGRTTPAALCQRLDEYGLGGLTVHVGENLALSGERLITARARELTEIETGPLCAVIVENPNYERSLRSCIPDGEFVRGKAPMTKAEVRGVAVAKLDIAPEDTCWDVGAGTGSVSVEMALRCGMGRVYAVEREGEAVELLKRNRIKFGCDNIEAVHASASAALPSLPRPDRVFNGGSGGELTEIAALIRAKNPDALVAAAAVSLETLCSLTKLFDSDCEITQIAVTRTKKIGAHTMLSAENPVFIVKGRLK